jgi:hypothetical protein
VLLHQCAAVDLTQRNLDASAGRAAATMGNLRDQAYRSVLAELLDRALYLHNFAMAHTHIMSETSLDALVEKAAALITSTGMSEHFFKDYNISADDLVAENWLDVPWPRVLAIKLGAEDFLNEINEFHFKIAIRMSTHLTLTFENISRSSWLAGRMLSTNAQNAAAAARELQRKLVGLRPDQRSAFEEGLCSDEALMQQLADFADINPSVVLWGAKGHFRELYRVLAARFLSNQDNCLRVEGIHSRWQWLARMRRNVKLPLLNALLRIQFRLNEGGGVPKADELLEYFEFQRLAFVNEYEVFKRDGTIPSGQRRSTMYLERFNLSVHDAELLKIPNNSVAKEVVTSARVSLVDGVAEILCHS